MLPNLQTLFSVAGIEDSFGGRSKLRGIVNPLLAFALSFYGEAKRPFFQPSNSLRLVNQMSDMLERPVLSEDLFSVSFEYAIQQNNDHLLTLLLELWFEYEQPFFCFFQTSLNPERRITPQMNWKAVVEMEPCLVMFKSVEEDVVWLGKSASIGINIDDMLA